jgi:hypothetical protein
VSRSRRKPYATQGYGSPVKKLSKRLAARAVRNEEEVANGASYRKVSNSWDICDYKFWSPKTPKMWRK